MLAGKGGGCVWIRSEHEALQQEGEIISTGRPAVGRSLPAAFSPPLKCLQTRGTPRPTLALYSGQPEEL